MAALVGVLRQNGKHGIVELDRKDSEPIKEGLCQQLDYST